MARFTQSSSGDGAAGPQGPQGPAGADGADALWNFIGEYDNGADYYPGDLVTYNGGTYYRVGEPNPGYPPGTSYWTTIAEPGEVGPQGEPGVSGATAVLSHEVKAGEAISKGQAVYVSSADGTNMIVSKASNVSETTSSKTMGLITTDLAHNGQGSVITEGLLTNLNTASANAGDPVWLGTNGNLIYGLANKPVAPAHLVFIGIVTRSNANTGEIFVKVQNGFELNELHTVLLESNGSLGDNEVLAFDSASGLWKNQTAAEAGIATESYVGTAISNLVGTDLSVAGKLSLTASSGNEGGEIFLNKPVTNTSINGGVTIDVYQNRLRIFEQGGDVRGAYIDMTKLPTGVAGELLFKSSAFVNAGYDVTLGNLKARIPTSGNRSLQLSTITGTYSVYGSDVYTAGGLGGMTIDATSPRTITTTPTYLNSGYHFNGAGQTDTWTLVDAGNNIGWRITMVLGASYNNNFISIERL